MKALLRKLVIIVPLGIIVGGFVVRQMPIYQQIEAEQGTLRAQGASPASAGKLAAAAVLSIDPMRVPRTAPVTPTRATAASLTRELASAKQYKPVFERLQSSGEGETAEGWYAKYTILHSCATLADSRPNAPQTPGPDERRQRFLAGLSDSDAQKAMRLAAFEQLDENRCLGFEGVRTSEAELARLIDGAARAGDAKAKAALVERDMWSAYRATGSGTGTSQNGPGLPSLDDVQIEELKGSILSKDPEAMLIAGRVLSNSIHDLTLQIAPDWKNVDQSAFYNAWQLLGCDYGVDCGASHAKVLSACAYQGHCGATTLADNLYFYGNSPYQSQLLEQYRSVLRQVVETGDWSQLRFTRGTDPVGSRYFVRGSP